MGLEAYYLADTSAVARIGQDQVHRRLGPLIEAGLIARCAITDLEAGVSARNGDDWATTLTARSAWPRVEMPDPVLSRALEVQGHLAARGQHRTVKLPDLLIAAAAEAANLVVLHYDRDFERIAGITGQTVEWVALAGTLD